MLGPTLKLHWGGFSGWPVHSQAGPYNNACATGDR